MFNSNLNVEDFLKKYFLLMLLLVFMLGKFIDWEAFNELISGSLWVEILSDAFPIIGLFPENSSYPEEAKGIAVFYTLLGITLSVFTSFIGFPFDIGGYRTGVKRFLTYVGFLVFAVFIPVILLTFDGTKERSGRNSWLNNVNDDQDYLIGFLLIGWCFYALMVKGFSNKFLCLLGVKKF